MTKAIIKTEGQQGQTQSNFIQLRDVVNGRLSVDNLQGRYIEGTTGTANTEKLFRHELRTEPVGILTVYGNVYVNALNSSTIDVRSTVDNASFKLFVIK